MKTKNSILIFLLILSVIFSSRVAGQNCCPFMDSIKILPSHPNIYDNVEIVVGATTPNLGFKLGLDYTFINQDSIYITGCYSEGGATQPSHHVDTINLGQLAEGNYFISFFAFISYNFDSCIHVDSNSTTLQFHVTLPNNILDVVPLSEVGIAPNPAEDKIYLLPEITAIDELTIYSLYGQQIKIIKGRQTFIDITELNEGIYFLVVKTKEKSLMIKFIKCKST